MKIHRKIRDYEKKNFIDVHSRCKPKPSKTNRNFKAFKLKELSHFIRTDNLTYEFIFQASVSIKFYTTQILPMFIGLYSFGAVMTIIIILRQIVFYTKFEFFELLMMSYC